MTIAISIKVNDGLILATDSASTLLATLPNGQLTVVNVYNNANKVFNLQKGLPIGAMTWGAGSIGVSSISTLMKDLRARFSGHSRSHRDWKLDPDSYSMDLVAQRVKEFLYDEHYLKAHADWPQKPVVGFMVGGYSAGEMLAEEFQIDVIDGECKGPYPIRTSTDVGVSYNGQPEAIHRLIFGFSPALTHVLEADMQVPPQQINDVVTLLRNKLEAPLIHAAMPVQDAIDLAEFLVNLSKNFARFSPGADTVGGPTEIAAITKHEGFKWIKRKHYFNGDLNPGEHNER